MTRRQHCSTVRSARERKASVGRHDAQRTSRFRMSLDERLPTEAAAQPSGALAAPAADATGGAAGRRVKSLDVPARREPAQAPLPTVPQDSGLKGPALVCTAGHTTSQQRASISASAGVSMQDVRPAASPGIAAPAHPRAPISRIMSSSSIAEGRPRTPKRRWRFAARLKPFSIGHRRPHTDSPRVPEPVPRDSSEAHTEDPADAQVLTLEMPVPNLPADKCH